MITIRRLVQEKSSESAISHEQLITYLVSIYDTITVPLARASILWLIGHHHATFKYAADALRISLKTYTEQDSFVKSQIITVAALLHIRHSLLENSKQKDFVISAYEYVMKLAKFDLDYDVRDEARLLEFMVSRSLGIPQNCEWLAEILTQSTVSNDYNISKRKFILTSITISNW